jgi:hypothetical protein
MSKIFFLLMILLTSCASAARDWSDWYRCGIEDKGMKWNLCREDLHGPKYHHKGLCYPALECRHRKTILGNERREERAVMLFCEWGDIDCNYSYNHFQMELIYPQ